MEQGRCPGRALYTAVQANYGEPQAVSRDATPYWKKGLKHGKGTFTHANGKVEEGIWKKGKLVK